jgi:hypothetical protein
MYEAVSKRCVGYGGRLVQAAGSDRIARSIEGALKGARFDTLIDSH